MKRGWESWSDLKEVGFLEGLIVLVCIFLVVNLFRFKNGRELLVLEFFLLYIGK